MKIEKTPVTTPIKKRRASATPKKTKNPENIKHRRKTEDERFELKHEVAIRLRKGQSRNRVAETMERDGFNISRNSVYAYAKQIHEEWVKTKNQSYELHVTKQLAMLDAMIEQCWKMLAKSEEDAVTTTTGFGFDYDENEEEDPSDENPKGRTKIRRVGRKSEGSDENPKGVKKQLSEKIEKKSRDGDVEILKMLERFWIRRCEILGISLNTTINIQNNQFNNTIVPNENKPISEQFFQSVIIEEDVRNGMIENQKNIEDAIIDDEND